jgi:hypothetical protein
MSVFFQGAIAMGCAAVGLFYFRFWRRLGDRLFAFFAASFWLLGIERVLLAAVPVADEHRPYVYLIRLVAFVLIIVGIFDKNRARERSGTAR